MEEKEQSGARSAGEGTRWVETRWGVDEVTRGMGGAAVVRWVEEPKGIEETRRGEARRYGGVAVGLSEEHERR